MRASGRMRDVLRALLALNAEEEASYFTTEVYPPSAIIGRSYRENMKNSDLELFSKSSPWFPLVLHSTEEGEEEWIPRKDKSLRGYRKIAREYALERAAGSYELAIAIDDDSVSIRRFVCFYGGATKNVDDRFGYKYAVDGAHQAKFIEAALGRNWSIWARVVYGRNLETRSVTRDAISARERELFLRVDYARNKQQQDYKGGFRLLSLA